MDRSAVLPAVGFAAVIAAAIALARRKAVADKEEAKKRVAAVTDVAMALTPFASPTETGVCAATRGGGAAPRARGGLADAPSRSVAGPTEREEVPRPAALRDVPWHGRPGVVRA